MAERPTPLHQAFSSCRPGATAEEQERGDARDLAYGLGTLLGLLETEFVKDDDRPEDADDSDWRNRPLLCRSDLGNLYRLAILTTGHLQRHLERASDCRPPPA